MMQLSIFAPPIFSFDFCSRKMQTKATLAVIKSNTP